MIGVAIALPLIFRYVPEVDQEEILTRTGTRIISEEEKSLLALRLARAGVDMAPEYFQGIKIAIVSISMLAIVFLFLLSSSFLYLIIFLPFLFFLPDLVIKNRIKNRQVELKRNADSFITFLASNLISVSDIAFALKEAAEVTGGVYKSEIEIVLKEISSGKNFADALVDFANRCEIDEIYNLVTELIQIEIFGAPAAEKMQELADKIRKFKNFDISEQAGKQNIYLLLVIVTCMVVPMFMIIFYVIGYSAFQIL